MNQYKLILSVSISHSYFQKKIDPSLRFQPSKSTIDLMNRFKIIVRQTISRIELYCDTEESIKSILLTIIASTEISSLDFEFNFNNPSFSNYTEISGTVDHLVFSSDNKLNRNENENIFLHPSFTERQNENRFGQLHIQLVDLLKFHNTSNHVNFNISFNARSTYWQYVIINSRGFSSNEMSIESNSGIKFSISKEIDLNNIGNKTIFTSKTLIPFSNVFEHKFDLKNRDETIIKGLPNTDIESLRIVKSNGETLLYSSTFINL